MEQAKWESNMKLHPIIYVVVLLGMVSCNRQSDVVSESYVHRYGVPLAPEEWTERGEQGQVVTVMNNGVVVSRSYEAGILDGPTTYTYPHRDAIEREEIYSKGQLNEEIWNDTRGVPCKKLIHVSPTSQQQLTWYDNGVPRSDELFENKQMVTGRYYNSNHVQEAIVENGNGTRISRNPLGEMESTDDIVNGHMANRTTYHSNGVPSSITPFVNGVAVGNRLTYTPHCEPCTIEEWKDGYQHGVTVVYENGERCAQPIYVRGQKHGTELRYKEDGKTVVEEISWVNGSRQGPSHTYVGDAKKTEWYFKDKHVNKQTYEAMMNQQLK